MNLTNHELCKWSICRGTNQVIGFRNMSYEGRMNKLELFDKCYCLIRVDLILIFTTLHMPNHPPKELSTPGSTRVTYEYNLSVSIPHTRSICRCYFFQSLFASRGTVFWNRSQLSLIPVCSNLPLMLICGPIVYRNLNDDHHSLNSQHSHNIPLTFGKSTFTSWSCKVCFLTITALKLERESDIEGLRSLSMYHDISPSLSIITCLGNLEHFYKPFEVTYNTGLSDRMATSSAFEEWLSWIALDRLRGAQ